jgi:2-haloacid dehalogenase
MPELVAELDAAGVPLFAITNFSAEFWAPFAAREAALFDRFRSIVVSGEEKMVKPDPAHLRAGAGTVRGCRRAEALFVDDRADNVAAAEGAGMRAHLFVDEPPLRARLARKVCSPSGSCDAGHLGDEGCGIGATATRARAGMS